jgi:formyl-CoA transferase
MMSRADVVGRLHGAKVPVAAVRGVGEVVEDRHLHERGALALLHHPQLGDVVVPHSPLRYRGSALAALEPSPALGQHNADVYGGLLGLSTTELQQLRASGVI